MCIIDNNSGCLEYMKLAAEGIYYFYVIIRKKSFKMVMSISSPQNVTISKSYILSICVHSNYM